MDESTRILTNEEIEQLYPALLEQCFGVAVDPSGVSCVVVVENEDGEIQSFLSGYWHTAYEFYIKYTGVLPHARTIRRNPAKRHLLAGMRCLGARFYRTRHAFGDTACQRVLADAKFFVHGSHIDTGGGAWIDWIKDMGEQS